MKQTNIYFAEIISITVMPVPTVFHLTAELIAAVTSAIKFSAAACCQEITERKNDPSSLCCSKLSTIIRHMDIPIRVPVVFISHILNAKEKNIFGIHLCQ